MSCQRIREIPPPPPPPPGKITMVYSISDMYNDIICISRVLIHRGGGENNVLQTKNGERVSLQHMKYIITINRSHFDISMKFCKVVVHDLTNDFSYDAKWNRSKFCCFGGKIVKIMCKNSEKLDNFVVILISIFLDILV